MRTTFQISQTQLFSSLTAKIIMAVVATLIIVFLLPRDNSRYNFDYEVGQPWRHEQLIAPFEFIISKDGHRMTQEQDSVLYHEYQPYFEQSLSVVADNLARFDADLTAGRLGNMPPQYAAHIKQVLRQIYSQGVVSNEDWAMLHSDSIQAIRKITYIKGNAEAAAPTPLKIIYSQANAYRHLMSYDTLLVDRQRLQNYDLNNYITPNLKYDAIKSEAIRTELLASISPLSGKVMAGEKIIGRGESVDALVDSKLKSLLEESERNRNIDMLWKTAIGQCLIVALLFTLLVTYLHVYRRERYVYGGALPLLFTLMVVFPVLTSLFVANHWANIYILPYAILPMVVRIFLDSRTALVAHTLMVLMTALAIKEPLAFVTTQMIFGLVALFTLREMSQRSQLVRTALIITAVAVVYRLADNLVNGILPTDMPHREWFIIAVHGVSLLFAYPLLFVVEKMFGFTSAVTLLELSNTNTPLLRRLSKEAQGTFNHSMQVANLATEVANALGARALLVRTAALYHDIGKLKHPVFFTENQTSNNPHDQLGEEASAAIIIEHVTEGIAIATREGLPYELRDFIATHHGNGLVKYFYIQAKNKAPEGVEVDESLYRYPGPNPATLEQAILMMCDAVEASSRSLQSHDEESISTLVNRIVDGQVAEGFFTECAITFKQIATAKRVLIDNLKIIYHTRIQYPEDKAKANPDAEKAGWMKL